MLARENRILKSADFRATIKGGRRVNSAHLVLYLKRVQGQPSARFGFVVSKAIGGAVQRNLVKRRLRELSRAHLALAVAGSDYVVRALPGIEDLDWNRLSSEFNEAAHQAAKLANR